MTKTLNRHFSEIIMILTELFISILLMLQLHGLFEVMAIVVGLVSICCGVSCIKNYYHTSSKHLRYEPEYRRGILLVLAGTAGCFFSKRCLEATNAPLILVGIILLNIGFFKTSVVSEALQMRASNLHLPALSTALTLAAGVLPLFSLTLSAFKSHLLVFGFLITILLVDLLEIYFSEVTSREPWSMQIRCWM